MSVRCEGERVYVDFPCQKGDFAELYMIAEHVDHSTKTKHIVSSVGQNNTEFYFHLANFQQSGIWNFKILSRLADDRLFVYHCNRGLMI